MIYKRGCDKKGLDSTCSKCGKRGSCGVYWYKFQFGGKLIRESTKQGNDKVARNMQSAHRTALANGLVGIREKNQVPTLSDFLKNDFSPYVDARHKAKPATADYYHDGEKMLNKCDFASLKVDAIIITISTRKHSPPSSPNCHPLESTADCGHFAAR